MLAVFTHRWITYTSSTLRNEVEQEKITNRVFSFDIICIKDIPRIDLSVK
jgi:hypothetical protein